MIICHAFQLGAALCVIGALNEYIEKAEGFCVISIARGYQNHRSCYRNVASVDETSYKTYSPLYNIYQFPTMLKGSWYPCIHTNMNRTRKKPIIKMNITTSQLMRRRNMIQ